MTGWTDEARAAAAAARAAKGGNRGGDYHNIDRNLRGPGKHTGYGDGVWHIQKYGGGATTYMATHRDTGANMYGRTLGEISQKLDGASKGKAMTLGRTPHDIAREHGVPTDHLKR